MNEDQIPELLRPYLIEKPSNPSRVFSGVECVYLRFDSAEQAEGVFSDLFLARGCPEDHLAKALEGARGDFTLPGVGDFSVIGTIYNDDAEYGVGDHGMPIIVTPPTAKPGWHVNLLPA
ncbi:MAG TPA: hypothetical protein PL193_07550 [Xanthobacteraceae bacterium]|nr:hypothetical protein [Xanthobacteraceae bacterium]